LYIVVVAGHYVCSCRGRKIENESAWTGVTDMLMNTNEYLSINALLDKIKDRDIFLWYAERSGESG